jgi:RNA polymerase sigma-70 factor (ECF subfamily)
VTDEELMQEVKRGGEQALQLLHRRYAPLIFALAARSLGPAGADDIVQDVILAVWMSRASYQPERGAVRPWLLEIAHTRILNELRRRRRHPSEALDESGGSDGLDFAEPGNDDAPEAAAWRTQRQSVLQAALAELPPAERQAVRLAFFEELSHSEVAAFLRTPLGTVKTRIRTGLGRLFRKLSPMLGPTVVALVVAGGMLWSARNDLGRNDRAVRMLSLSDSETIRLAAVAGIPVETHGTFRWHPGVATAVVTLSHPPPREAGAHAWAWARFGERWLPLCTLVPTTSDRAMCIAEGAELGQVPSALVITSERRVGREPSARALVRWEAP